ncbi:hypothetical protein PHMEG_00040091, partial [Phytophthora megakarya]
MSCALTDTVREPWMPSEKVVDDRYGAQVPPNEIPLYVDTRIVDGPEAAAKHFDNSTNQRRDYYISLFHELRYWSSKKTSGRSRVPEWHALCQSWNQFVANFNSGPAAYRERIASARERFIKFSKTSVVQRVYEGSVNANIPCAVPEGSVVGFVRHHHFRNIRHQDVSGKPGDPIVSNEYENEPDLGSSSDWYGQQSDPPRGGSNRGQSYASVGGAGRSSYGQPRVDHGLQALHACVEALATVQASESAEFRQQLNLQKAYVAEAAQTTSNIRYEVLESPSPGEGEAA